MHSGGSGLSIDIHFVDIELSYDVLSPLPTLLSKHFNHPHPYIEIATAISDTYALCTQNTSEYANDFSEAAVDRDKTKPFTVERYVHVRTYVRVLV